MGRPRHERVLSGVEPELRDVGEVVALSLPVTRRPFCALSSGVQARRPGHACGTKQMSQQLSPTMSAAVPSRSHQFLWHVASAYLCEAGLYSLQMSVCMDAWIFLLFLGVGCTATPRFNTNLAC